MGASLPKAALVWFWTIVLLGVLTGFAGGIQAYRLDARDWALMVVFAAVVVMSDVRGIKLGPFNIEISLSMGILFGAALMFQGAAVVLALGSLVADILRHRYLSRSVFNAALTCVEVYCSARVWATLRPTTPDDLPSLLGSGGGTLAWLAAGLVFLIINVVSVLTMVSLADRTGLPTVLRSSVSTIVVQLLTLPTLGVLVADLYDRKSSLLFLVALPLVAVQYSLRSAEQLRRQTFATIERLTDVLDRRDPATERHSQRVAEYSRLICRAMDLPADLTAATVSAARVHDLGKIGVPDAVLFKPTQLTPDEWKIVRQHPDVGAEILSQMETYAASTRIIRHHHERWDGTGYPAGLSGREIPLGARILAVADAYDVMTSVRPYRVPLQPRTVMEELTRKSGHQFDPAVVRAFLSVMGDDLEPTHNAILSTPPASR